MEKHNKPILAIILSVLLIAAVGVFAAFGAKGGASASEEANPYMHSVGDLYKAASENPSSKVLARYHGIEITEETVEYYQELWASSSMTEKNTSRREVLERIIRNVILTVEAEDRGLSASEEEVEAQIAAQREAYQTNENVRELMDEYCKGAGLSYEAYLEQEKEPLARSLSRSKLEDALAREWCAEHGVEYSQSQPPEGMQEAVEAELDRIVAAHMGEAVFFVD